VTAKKVITRGTNFEPLMILTRHAMKSWTAEDIMTWQLRMSTELSRESRSTDGHYGVLRYYFKIRDRLYTRIPDLPAESTVYTRVRLLQGAENWKGTH
jgi:hypothetical protein